MYKGLRSIAKQQEVNVQQKKKPRSPGNSAYQAKKRAIADGTRQPFEFVERRKPPVREVTVSEAPVFRETEGGLAFPPTLLSDIEEKSLVVTGFGPFCFFLTDENGQSVYLSLRRALRDLPGIHLKMDMKLTCTVGKTKDGRFRVVDILSSDQ